MTCSGADGLKIGFWRPFAVGLISWLVTNSAHRQPTLRLKGLDSSSRSALTSVRLHWAENMWLRYLVPRFGSAMFHFDRWAIVRRNPPVSGQRAELLLSLGSLN